MTTGGGEVTDGVEIGEPKADGGRGTARAAEGGGETKCLRGEGADTAGLGGVSTRSSEASQ